MSDSEHDSIDGDEGWDSESVSDDIPVTDIPLYERLQREEEKNQRAAQSHSNKPPKKLKKTSSNDRKNSTKEGHKKAHKNAPAELPSNKPVRRLRVDANNTTAKRRDPRFSDLSGRLDTDKFLHSYKFLDEYQEDEIKRLQKTIAKSKSAAVKEEAKQELVKMKQQMTERRREVKVRERLQQAKLEEKEKVKQGKKAFFLKDSAKKEIALEVRYDELKKSGKLNQFMSKKRKRNANKDHRKIPYRRATEDS